MMGSMGTAVGEKITSLFEYATEHSLPWVAIPSPAGPGCRRGCCPLCRWPKTSGAVKRHSDARSVLLHGAHRPHHRRGNGQLCHGGRHHPGRAGATVGFAGARVVEQTTRKALPKGFQTAEFLLKHGFVDAIVPRRDQQQVVSSLLKLHQRGEAL